MYTVVCWFNGNKLPQGIYLSKRIITKANFKKYMPAQW